jgi:hypothetical protein
MAVANPSDFFLPGAPSSFLLTAAAESRAAIVGSVLPQAAAVFTDELPLDLKLSKPDLEPPPSNLSVTAALLSEFLSSPPSPYDGCQGEEMPYFCWAPYRLGNA